MALPLTIIFQVGALEWHTSVEVPALEDDLEMQMRRFIQGLRAQKFPFTVESEDSNVWADRKIEEFRRNRDVAIGQLVNEMSPLFMTDGGKNGQVLPPETQKRVEAFKADMVALCGKYAVTLQVRMSPIIMAIPMEFLQPPAGEKKSEKVTP